jgi:transposase-like protein
MTEERLVTTEKKCPKCESESVEPTGQSHGEGALEVPPIDAHTFKCKECGALFSFRGRL